MGTMARWGQRVLPYDLSNPIGKACPQAAAKNSFLYLPTRSGHALDPAFSLPESFHSNRPVDFSDKP